MGGIKHQTISWDEYVEVVKRTGYKGIGAMASDCMFDEAHYSFAQILHMITNDRHKSNIWYNHKTNECLMWCAGNLGVGDLIIMLQAMETKHGEDKQGVEDRHKDGDGAHEVEEGSKEDSGDASQGDSIVL